MGDPFLFLSFLEIAGHGREQVDEEDFHPNLPARMADSGLSGEDRAYAPRWVLVALGALYLLHAMLRVAAGEACQRDEAEQLILSQEWHWGYGSQGPLYTWLLRLLPAAPGSEVARLAVLKNTLLYGTHLFVYCLARRVLGSPLAALMASLGLFLIPGFVYESQRDQTHLVLASCLGAAATWFLVRIIMDRRPWDYLLFGLLAAASILSKYNMLLLLLGMAISVTRYESARGAFRTRWALAGLAVCGVALAPHLLWAWQHAELLLSQSHKLGPNAGVDPFRSRLLVAGKSLAATASYAPVLLVCIWAFRPGWTSIRRPPAGAQPAMTCAARLVESILAMTLLFAGLAALAGNTVSLKPRWFQPVMMLLPVWGLWRIQRCWSAPAMLRFGKIAVAAALIGGAAVHGTVWGAGWLRRPHRLNVDYGIAAAELRVEGFDGGLVISDDQRIAGSLAREFSSSVAWAPNLNFFRAPPDRPAVLVWDAATGVCVPDTLRRLAEPWVTQWPCHQPTGVVALPTKRGDPGQHRLAYLVIPAERVDREKTPLQHRHPPMQDGPGVPPGGTSSSTRERRGG